MNKKLLELLKDEKIQNEIKDLYCKLTKDSYEEGGMSGWYWSIILDEDGDVSTMYGSQGTSRMDIYEGKATVIATVNSMVEVSTDGFSDIYNVKDLEEFKNWIIQEYDIDINSEDAEDEIDGHISWSEYHEFNQEGYQKEEKETWESICDQYSYDEITDSIHGTIEDMERQVEYYNSFEQ